jgi:RNA ligase
MAYEFPIIHTIDDVLPHIEGREEFVVAERDFGTVINYVVIAPDTFPPIKVAGGSAKMRKERALTNAMRRECRGLIFDRDGKLMSRPFHKFFNIGEREETLMHNIDWSRPFEIVEKMDGSMVRPIRDENGLLRLATKMGLSDVALEAEEYFRSRNDYFVVMIWMERCLNVGLTPLFEYIAPSNRIVIDYIAADLVLLAIRHNETGNYLGPQNGVPETITQVPVHGTVDDIDAYLENARNLKDREGDIIRFPNGEMHKSKNDWYVRIHKTLDLIRFNRNIVDLVLNNDLDDVVPSLPAHEMIRVRDYETRFWNAFNSAKDRLARIYAEASVLDRKAIATEYVPTLEHKKDASFIFRIIDGHSIHELLLTDIKKNLSTNVKWEAYEKWLGI